MLYSSATYFSSGGGSLERVFTIVVVVVVYDDLSHNLVQIMISEGKNISFLAGQVARQKIVLLIKETVEFQGRVGKKKFVSEDEMHLNYLFAVL